MPEQLRDAAGLVAGCAGRRRCGDRARRRRIGQLDGERVLLRRIADAGIGATLRGHAQRQRQRPRAVALDRQPDERLVVEHLDATEGLVLLFLARWQQRRAEADRRRFGGEAELVAVQVISLGDAEAHLERLPVERTHARPEGHRRVEELFRLRQRGEQQQEREQAAEHWQPRIAQVDGAVSAATQARYSGRPAAMSSATTSGNSYG